MPKEQNPIWKPLWDSPLEMAEAYYRADPVETTLRTIWSYEEKPPRFAQRFTHKRRSQRYSLVLTEPLPAPVWR